MKRLALLLGSLLVVSAAASAKEVVPAPVVVEEAPVQVVEKEVIVYRDKEEGFRPNGFVSLEYRYYGDTEGKGHSGEWNASNNYTRMQLEGKINMTEKQAFEYRVRNYNSVDYNAAAGSNENDTQTRLRYYYDHGNLGETSVGMTSYVQYEKAGDQSLEYQLKFDLADYMFSNDYVKTTDLVVGPRYIYKWGSGNGNDYSNTLGLYADWKTQLPWGFSTEIEIDGLHYTWYGNTDKTDEEGASTTGTLVDHYGKDKYSDEIYFQVAATIYQDTNLYTNDKVSVDLHTEFGYDPYRMSNRSRYGHNEGLVGKDMQDRDWEYTSYSARYLSDVTVSYQATDFVKVYAGLGAEYRNWLVESTEDATDWRWQPYAFAGFNVAF